MTDRSLPSRKSVLWTLFLFLSMTAARLIGQVQLEEIGQSAGIHTSFQSYGVSVHDYDNDGWDDILFAGTNGVALFRNDADGTFTDVSQMSGLTYSAYFSVAVWADWDNDGDADLFLGCRDLNDSSRVLRNDGGVFVDISATAGVDLHVRIGSAAAGDFDNDGLVDLYLSTRDAFDQLYRNTSTGSDILLENVSELSGMKGISYSIGMQPTWIDFDKDGDQDLFVVHDGFDLSRLHQNDGSLPFPNLASPLSIANIGAGNSMGVAWGDIDNDGWQDVYVSRIDSGGLYRNTGGGPFQDVAGAMGADSNGMSWGVVIADLDNDGWQDISLVNVSTFGGKHPVSILFHNNRDGTFTDIGTSAGFERFQDFYGLATGDFDNDGRVDLVGASYSPAGQNRLWINRTANQNSWVKFKLLGRGGVNSGAIGASVRVVANGASYTRSILAGSSYCSQISPVIHIGLGSATLIDTLEIRWKGTHTEFYTSLAVDSMYTLLRTGTTGIHHRETGHPDELPRLSIVGAYPNPFNGSTRLVLHHMQSEAVRVAIFDLLGREVRLVTSEVMEAGELSIPVDLNGLSSGTYIVRAEGPASAASFPLFLLR